MSPQSPSAFLCRIGGSLSPSFHLLERHIPFARDVNVGTTLSHYTNAQNVEIHDKQVLIAQMPLSFPPAARLVSLDELMETLQKCRKNQGLGYAKNVVMYVFYHGLEAHHVIGNYLVPLLVDCELLRQAVNLFHRLLYRNEHAWTSLIQGYTDTGEYTYALYLFQKMQEDTVCASKYTLVAVLKACTKLKSLGMGQNFHVDIVKEGFEADFCIGSILVDMYVKCGCLLEARKVFDELPARDVITWTALIAGYAERGNAVETLKFLDQMIEEGLNVDAGTFVCCLKGCRNMESLSVGQQIHQEIVKHGFENGVIVGNSLVDMYSKSNSFVDAWVVFENMEIKDVVTWTSLIFGYAEYGFSQEALACFGQMQEEGVLSNDVTLACSLRVCDSIKNLNIGEEIHSLIVKRGLETNALVNSTLVAMYGRCQLFTEASDILAKLNVRDAVPWNALISGYADRGLINEALKVFEAMQVKGVSPDGITFVCGLKACCGNKDIDSVRRLHEEIFIHGHENDSHMGNCLVDSYVKCGSVSEAQHVFDGLEVQDVISWTTIIAGYAFQGMSGTVFGLFRKMRGQGILPDGIALQSVLTVCSHTGLVDKGHTYFETISRKYCGAPTINHRTVMVDILARAGQLDEAMEMLEKMPFQPDLVTWLSMLSACRKWGNVKLAEKSFNYAVKLDEEDDAIFFLMYNTYLDAQMWEDAKKINMLKLKTTGKRI